MSYVSAQWLARPVGSGDIFALKATSYHTWFVVIEVLRRPLLFLNSCLRGVVSFLFFFLLFFSCLLVAQYMWRRNSFLYTIQGRALKAWLSHFEYVLPPSERIYGVTRENPSFPTVLP